MSESVPRGNRPAPLDEENVIDNAVPSAVRFGQVPRTEVIRSIVLAIHEQGVLLAPAEPPEVAAAERDWLDAALRAERLAVVEEIRREMSKTENGITSFSAYVEGGFIKAVLKEPLDRILDEVGVAGLTKDDLEGGANNGPTWSNEPKDGWRP